MKALITVEPKLQSARRVANVLFAIGGLGGLIVMILGWLHVTSISVFWLLLFLPVLLPSSAFLQLLNSYERNCQLVAWHLKHTSLLPPTLGRYVAAYFTDLLIVGVTVVLPVILLIARTSEWASRSAAASEGSWIPWSLAMAAGWIVLAAVPIYTYVLWLPTTRMQARPGFWLLGLRMTDFEGHRLTRRVLRAQPAANPADPDADTEKPPAYLIVRRPMEDKAQLKLTSLEP